MEVKERRTHPRYHVGECGYLEALEANVYRNRQEVYIADISPGGLGLHLECALPIGCSVRVILSKCTIAGVVAYCRVDEDTYVAGIRASKAAEHVEKLRTRVRPLDAQPASK